MSKESKGAQNPPDSASAGQTPAGEGRMKLAFEMKTVRLALGDISPLHQIKDLHKGTFRYKKIISSLKIVGSVEPMVVYPQKDAPGKYLLKNGHLRLAAMKELGFTTALCIVATDDECYTYNARINRLPPIQEHKMIVKAVNDGVSPERLAEALDMPVHVIMAAMRLLNGIDERAAELLKDKNISQPATHENQVRPFCCHRFSVARGATVAGANHQHQHQFPPAHPDGKISGGAGQRPAPGRTRHPATRAQGEAEAH